MNWRRTCGTSTPYRLHNEQVRVQLPTSADNVALLAFAADRRAAIDRYLLGTKFTKYLTIYRNIIVSLS